MRKMDEHEQKDGEGMCVCSKLELHCLVSLLPRSLASLRRCVCSKVGESFVLVFPWRLGAGDVCVFCCDCPCVSCHVTV